MKRIDLAESIGSIKIRTALKQGKDGVVYNGSPSGYQWRASTIKNYFDSLEKLLNQLGRKFDKLLITKWSNTRYFVAVSQGTPEVVYYYYYDAHGYNTSVYVDWLRVKTNEFLAFPQDEQLRILTTPVNPDPAAIWKKERAIEVIGAAFETMDKDAVDTAIDSLGSKLVNAVSKLEIDNTSLYKLASFTNSLLNINTTKTNNLAQKGIQAYKKVAILKMLNDIKSQKWGPWYTLADIVKLKRAGFDWPEFDTITKSLKSPYIKYALEEIKRSGMHSHTNISGQVAALKSIGLNWPELDVIGNSLKVGNN